MKANPWSASVVAIAIAASFSPAAQAEDETTTLRKEVEQLRQEVSELRALVKNQGQTAATKEEVTAVKAEVVRVAEQPAPTPETSSKFLVTGYGVVGYANGPDTSGSFSMVGFSPIFLYQYKDLLLFQAELETAVGPDGGTEVGLEYAEANVFVNDYLSLFGGKVLTPLGYFIRNLHPAWINRFASKPPGFGVEGGAAPESDVGVGARGGFVVGEAARANYALYVGNGPRLNLNSTGNEIEGVEASGATSNPGGGMFAGGRVGVLPIPGLELGLSGGTGKVAIEGESRRTYGVAGADLSFTRGPIGLRAEYIQQRVGDLASSAAPEGGTWKAWYTQLAYRISSTPWEPVIRFGDFSTPHPDLNLRQWGIGLNYWLTPSAVAKVGYEFNQGEAGTTNNADLFLLQFSYGF